MDDGTSGDGDISMASDVTMDEGTYGDSDMSMANDVTMDEGTQPCGDKSIGSPSNNISLKKRMKKMNQMNQNVWLPKKGIKCRAPTAIARAGGWD
ncbi:hypothetical protein AV530_010970 [Patagioenas fasciata monilis]|uniref:Uncharacterized protein n=1 Tax=Patagioenas fasciata monilis TaxID=372326 RepID=A0A1V4K9Z0_PATFA|nr:hypothetical protein AV530_010970 [Patagioenas fasciata monilis]